MRNYKSDRRDRNRRFGGRNSGRDRDRGRRDRKPQEMYDVTCEKCKQECQVPFKPSGDKPVLCSECFKKEGGGSKSKGMSSEQFAELNSKLDKILKILGPDRNDEVENLE